jgi:aspartyl-tRNA synthetase
MFGCPSVHIIYNSTLNILREFNTPYVKVRNDDRVLDKSKISVRYLMVRQTQIIQGEKRYLRSKIVKQMKEYILK